MSYDYILLGKKLQEARESLLIEPSEAGEFLEISEKDYLSLESGDKKANGDQILALADLYCRDFRYFVKGDYPSAESQLQKLFRSNNNLSKRDRMAIQEFIRLCEYEHFLEREILKKEYGSIQNYNNFKDNYFKAQGIEVAQRERQHLNLGEKPINNIFELLREQGIHVFKRQLEDKNISALYIKHTEAGHCILVNYTEDLYRQNFSAAHEYCHALCDSSLQQELSYSKLEKQPEIEVRANYFAREFLLPKEGLKSLYQPANSYEGWLILIKNICKQFKVSSQPVIYQLSDLKWIDDELKTKLLRDKELTIKQNAKIDPEIAGDFSPGTKERLTQFIRKGLSWHFVELATQAYRQGEITYHKLLDMLFLPREEGQELLDSTITQSKRISNAELSCIVLAKRLGGKVMTDDKKAVKYLKTCGYLDSPSTLIITLVDILLDAHYNDFINEYDLQRMKSTLEDKKFRITIDLVQEATRRRLMKNPDN